MRIALVALAALAFTPHGGAAQVLPAEKVAELTRRALASPHDSASWAGLARTLPELAITGGASLEETFEAARIADSLAAESARPAPVVRPAPAVVSQARASAPSRAETKELPIAQGALVLALVALAAALAASLVRRAREGRAAKASARRGARLPDARALARDAADIGEVARRTGMAREAVTLAMRLNRPVGRRVA